MAVYLVDHPPRIQQFRCPRRRSPSGIIGVHTAESFADETGPDTGAESVAAFIARRTNPGSYHLLADSDSVIQLIEFSCVAYHIATHGFNEHTIGISAAAQAAKWNQLDPDYRRAMVRNMARAAAIAARWLKSKHGITVPARRITLAQALNGAKGFLAHGDADPDRRTDPGSTFPWSMFLADYAAFMAGGTPTPEEDDMPYTEAQLKQIAKDAIAEMKLEIQDAAADGVDQSLNGTNVPSKLRAIASSGVWGAFFGRGENRQTAATVLATTKQQNAALLAVLTELEAEGKLSDDQAQRVAAAAVVEDVDFEPGEPAAKDA